MKHSSKVIGAFLAMAMCLPVYAGKVYKWQDESGAWHYSEKPPMEGEPEIIKLKNTYAGAPEEENLDEVLEAKPRTEAPKGSALEPPVEADATTPLYTAEERRANCAIARERLSGLETHPRTLIRDEQTGEPRYLTPEEHENWQKTSKEEIKKFCD
jgi:hypothetical protein